MVRLTEAEPKLVPAGENHGFRLTAQDLRDALTPKTPQDCPELPPQSDRRGLRRGASARHLGVLLEAGLWVLSDDVYEHMTYDGGARHLFRIKPRRKERSIRCPRPTP